jgi:hypothetical protein
MHVLIAQVLAPFIAPALAWAGVALVTIPVAIHLLSRWRRKPEPWGAMRFLLEAYRKQKQRMRFEQLLLLLLRCLIILMLGLALARPLLVGTLGQWLGALDNQGRVVNIVIDDAMSTRASDGPGVTRFDRLIDKATSVIDSLDAGDRATIWRAGRPAGPVIAEPTVDRAALLTALNQMRPGYSRPDLPAALELISDRSDTYEDAHDRSVTIFLGDFTRSSRYIDQVSDAGAQAIEPSGTLVVSRPMGGLENMQVLSVKPRRQVVWSDGLTGGRIAAEVRVARYTDALSEASISLVVALIDSEGRSLSTLRREVYFLAGQSIAAVSVDLSVEAALSRLDAQGGEVLTIRAQLESAKDGLIPDDQAHAAVELRRRLRVAVVDEPASISAGVSAGLTPGQWVTLALRPQGVGQAGAVEVVSVTASELNDPSSLESLDAVMLMRPDRLFNPVWRELAEFAESGGLVWVFTPANDGSAPWVGTMLESFDPGWQIGLETVDIEDVAEIDGAKSGESWGLSSEPLSAEPLERLAADWQALIRPVRIYHRLPLVVSDGDAWVSLSQTMQTGGETGNFEMETVLAHHAVGRGSLMLLSTAVDTRWTNLPTKPLFVPLIHETLRGVLGLRDRPGIVHAVAGDQPTLGSAWAGLSELGRLEVSGDLIINEQEAAPDHPEWTVGAEGVELAGPIAAPGVYQASSDAGPRRLIIDADTLAGDTRQIDEEAFSHWLDGLGEWRWLDDENPGSSLGQSGDVADIGWALLWVLLALVALETVLSRFMSHANAGPGGISLTGRLWRAAIQLRSGEKSAKSGRGRAA